MVSELIKASRYRLCCEKCGKFAKDVWLEPDNPHYLAPLPFSDHAVTYDGEWYGADTGVTGIPGLLEENE